jgi:protein-L-isoaspartate(D-aspartate) O-methyltransferase
MVDNRVARRAMVDCQVRTSDVTHLGLIAAMLDIPREPFVPEASTALAYLDCDVRLTGATATEPARYILKPMVSAKLIQAADPALGDRVLVVGAGTGYSAAVLARLAASVVALEQNPTLLAQARTVLPKFGGDKVTIVDGPLVGGAPGSAPYDIILIDGGVEILPDVLRSQLSPHGRLVTVVNSGPGGRATLFGSGTGNTSGQFLFDAVAPLLPGFAEAPAFVF